VGVRRRDSGWESERLIGGAIEAAPIAFTVLAEDGRYLAANGAASRFSGYSRGELLGMRSADLSADRTRTTDAIETVFRTGSGAGVRQLLRADGSILPVQYRLAPAKLGPDRLMVAAWWPAEAEDEAGADEEPADGAAAADSAAQARILGLAFQRAPIAVTVSDRAGSYLALNDRACEITGYSRAELFELGAFGVVVSPGPPAGGDLTLLPGIRSGEAEVRCRGGSMKTVSFRAATTILARQKVRIGVWWETG
jgi:PAS domain S-box-containing protein